VVLLTLRSPGPPSWRRGRTFAGVGGRRFGGEEAQIRFAVLILSVIVFASEVDVRSERLAVSFVEIVVVLDDAVEHTLGRHPAKV
jgi:hypothetical protein